MTQDRDHLAVAIHVAGILERLGVRHTIGGSIAASLLQKLLGDRDF